MWAAANCTQRSSCQGRHMAVGGSCMGSRGWIVVGWWRDCGVVTDGAVGCDVVVAGLWRGCGWVGCRLPYARRRHLGPTSPSLWKTRSEKSDLASPTEDEVGKIRPHLHTEDEVLPTRSDHGRRGRGEVVPRNVVSCVVMPHNVTIPSQPQTTSWCN